MSTEAERFDRVASAFDAVVAGVSDWDAPAPCSAWVARDVVRHLVGWVPGMFTSVGVTVSESPSVDDDPAAAWGALRDALASALADPDVSARTMVFGPAGEHTVPVAVDRFVTPDVLVHSWDLARASGQDVTLDDEVAAGTLAGFEMMGDALVQSGHFGAPVPVAPDADVQERLIAASGRDPNWQP
jgi:uncharacterized protein (TIGR03086 family)